GIIDSGEHGSTVAAITDVDVADHRRSRDGTETYPYDLVQRLDGKTRGFVEYIACIDERRHFYLHVRYGIEREYPPPQLDGRREGIPIIEAPLAIASQRLHAPDDGLPATDAAECPEWQVARIAGQITKGHVARQCGEIVNRPEHPSVDPSLAVQRIV